MKNNEPLGATAKIGDDGSLTVARIIKGGAADRSGLIHINDRIIEVNGIRAKKSNVEVRIIFKIMSHFYMCHIKYLGNNARSIRIPRSTYICT